MNVLLTLLKFPSFSAQGLYQPPPTHDSRDPSIPWMSMEGTGGAAGDISVPVTGVSSTTAIGNVTVEVQVSVSVPVIGVSSATAIGGAGGETEIYSGTMVCGQLIGADLHIENGYTAGQFGSINPTTIEGHTISEITDIHGPTDENPPAPRSFVALLALLSQSFFSRFEVSGVSRLTSEATNYEQFGGTTMWHWEVATNEDLMGIPPSGSVPVKFFEGTAGELAHGDANVFPSGVASSANLGTVTVEAEQGGGSINVPVTGVVALTGLGQVNVSAEQRISTTGVSTQSSVGTVTVQGEARTNVSGVSTQTGLGDEAVSGEAITTPSGVSTHSAVGTVTLSTEQRVPATGIQTAGKVGQVTVIAEGEQLVNVTGVATLTSLGSASVDGEGRVTASGVSTLTALGNESVSGSADVVVTGHAALTAVGTVTLTGEARVTPQGVRADTGLGQVSVTTPSVSVNVTGVSASTHVGDVSIPGVQEEAQEGLDAVGLIRSKPQLVKAVLSTRAESERAIVEVSASITQAEPATAVITALAVERAAATTLRPVVSAHRCAAKLCATLEEGVGAEALAKVVDLDLNDMLLLLEAA